MLGQSAAPTLARRELDSPTADAAERRLVYVAQVPSGVHVPRPRGEVRSARQQPALALGIGAGVGIAEDSVRCLGGARRAHHRAKA